MRTKYYYTQKIKSSDIIKTLDFLFNESKYIYNSALNLKKQSPKLSYNSLLEKVNQKRRLTLGDDISVSVIRKMLWDIENFNRRQDNEKYFKITKDIKVLPFIIFYKFKETDRDVTINLSENFKRKYRVTDLEFSIPNNFRHDFKSIRINKHNEGYSFVYEYYTDRKKDYEKDDVIAGIDLGMNNLLSVVIYSKNGDKVQPFIISGKPLKHLNHLLKIGKITIYDKRKLERLKINKMLKEMFNRIKKEGVKEIYMGYFLDIKRKDSLSSQFRLIPFNFIKERIIRMCKERNIRLVIGDESYTSRTSFIDHEKPEKLKKYKGNRDERGLFRTQENHLINADINGASQIIIKLSNYNIQNRENCKISPKIITI